MKNSLYANGFFSKRSEKSAFPDLLKGENVGISSHEEAQCFRIGTILKQKIFLRSGT